MSLKEWSIAVIAAITPGILLYFAISFNHMDLDPSNWPKDARGGLSFGALFFGTMSFIGAVTTIGCLPSSD